MARCPDCDGTGDPYHNRLGSGQVPGAKCRGCGGSGKVPGTVRKLSNPCTSCGGSGTQIRFGGLNSSGTCPQCSGTGKGPRPARTTRPSAAGLASELQKLTALHNAGALSAEEFRRAKAKLLGL